MPYTSSPSWTMRRPPLVPALIVSAGTLIAVIFWCLPSLPLFSEAMANLPTLWQIDRNHQVILVLAVRVLSPLFIAAILATCCWLSQAIAPELASAQKQAQARKSARKEARRPTLRTGQATVPVTRSSGTSQTVGETSSLQDSGRTSAAARRDVSSRPIVPGSSPATQMSRPAVSSPPTPTASERQGEEPSLAPASHNEVAASSAVAEPIFAEAEKTPRPVSLSRQSLTPSHGTSTRTPQARATSPIFIEIALLEDARIDVVAAANHR